MQGLAGSKDTSDSNYIADFPMQTVCTLLKTVPWVSVWRLPSTRVPLSLCEQNQG